MKKNMFLKVWAGLLSSLSLSATESVADLQTHKTEPVNNGHEIIKESSKPDLFLKHAKEAYSDSMLFAGHRSHRSHSSHRSHYSSMSNPAPTEENKSSSLTEEPKTNTPQKQPTSPVKPLKELNATDIKMLQVSLNLLGHSSEKVDGVIRSETKAAIEKFQTSENIPLSGKMDGQTCLLLARKLKEQFPNDANTSEIFNHLMNLYMKLETP